MVVTKEKKKPAAKTEKPPKAKKPTKAQLLEEKAFLFDKIRMKEKERRKLAVRLDEITKQRKAAKEALGYCETEICGLGFALDEKHPLFDQPAQPKAEKKNDNKPSSGSAQASEQKAVPENASAEPWLKHKIDVLKAKLTTKQYEAIQSAHVDTLGDLQALMNKHGMFWAKNCNPAINDRMRVPIEDAFNAYIIDQTKKAQSA